jgi:nickel-dependent lactate racemase
MRRALEEPVGFPALRRALTPDDHIAIVVDERLPRIQELTVSLLEYLAAAHISPDAITLVCGEGRLSPAWVNNFPEPYNQIHLEVHDPTNRKKMSYLATTRRGRRLYLNRTVVDADELIVLSRRTFDPLLGYGGSEGAIFPALADLATQKDLAARFSTALPDKEHWPVLAEATEVAWLLGAPFMIQVIEGAGDSVSHILGGASDSNEEGIRLLNARWRREVEAPADTVVALISGPAGRTGMFEVANALGCAARVVKEDGRILLLADAEIQLSDAFQLMRQADSPAAALQLLRKDTPPGFASAFQWASAANRARIYLLSSLPGEIADELFAIAIENADQVQRLLEGSGSCIVIPEANKTLAVVA